jgi:hypothetical protein
LDLGDEGFGWEVPVDDVGGAGGEELGFVLWGEACDGDDGFDAEELRREAGEEAGYVGSGAEEDDGFGGVGGGFAGFPWGWEGEAEGREEGDCGCCDVYR